MRGHRGQTAKFLREIETHDLIYCDILSVKKKRIRRNGRRVDMFPLITKDVVRARVTRKGTKESGKRVRAGSATYRLRNLTAAELRKVIREEERKGVIFPNQWSIDQREIDSDEWKARTGQ